MSESPFASVVIPTAGRAELLAGCLAALARQDHPRERFEVLVVVDGPDDGTGRQVAAAARDGLPVRALERPRGGPGSARNSGLRQAVGDPICFLDDDSVPAPGWLSAIVAGAARNPTAGLLGGPVEPRFDAGAPRTCERHQLAGGTLRLGDEDEEVDEVWGCNMALRRSAVERIGGFDERLTLSEDWEWGNRLAASGGTIVYLPDALIQHRRLRGDLRLRTLPWEFFRRGWNVGRLRGNVDARHEARAAVASLRHAARARCTRGLTDAARSLGLLLAALAPGPAARPPAG